MKRKNKILETVVFFRTKKNYNDVFNTSIRVQCIAGMLDSHRFLKIWGYADLT